MSGQAKYARIVDGQRWTAVKKTIPNQSGANTHFETQEPKGHYCSDTGSCRKDPFKAWGTLALAGVRGI